MSVIAMHRRLSAQEENRIILTPTPSPSTLSADYSPFHVVIRLRFIIDFIALPSPAAE